MELPNLPVNNALLVEVGEPTGQLGNPEAYSPLRERSFHVEVNYEHLPLIKMGAPVDCVRTS